MPRGRSGSPKGLTGELCWTGGPMLDPDVIMPAQQAKLGTDAETSAE